MKISYYPGCTLKTKAKELDVTARLCAQALGVEMEEIENWQCCGAVYKMGTDEIATKLSAIRALDYAKHHGGKLLTLCSACHNVIKRANEDMKTNADICTRANNYMALEEPYKGETEVLHYLEMLKNVVGFDNIKKAVVNPINRKVGAYYGCLLLRPSGVMAFDNPENPTIIEDFIRAIGGTPVVYPFRNECCGAYVSLKNSDLPKQKSTKVLSSAKEKGAEEVITACPLCLYNLQVNGGDILPVKYFTELLAEALGKSMTKEERIENLKTLSGADVRKCMKCGKCSGRCPAFKDMDIKPHQFVSMLAKGKLDELLESKAIWSCLSCMACVERCPRGVAPAAVVEAVRETVVRMQGNNGIKAEDIPPIVDELIPQQLLVSAYRKYNR